jgi:hypothetical protein
MKKMTLVTVSVCAFIAATATPLSAQEKAAPKPAPATGGGGHSHFTKIPATVTEIWAEIHKQQTKLAATVEKKDLGEAHDHAFAIRDLVKALPEKIAAENKTKAEEGAKEIAKIAAEIDKTAAARAQKATEANVKKMATAVTALEAKLKSVPVK